MQLSCVVYLGISVSVHLFFRSQRCGPNGRMTRLRKDRRGKSSRRRRRRRRRRRKGKTQGRSPSPLPATSFKKIVVKAGPTRRQANLRRPGFRQKIQQALETCAEAGYNFTWAKWRKHYAECIAHAAKGQRACYKELFCLSTTLMSLASGDVLQAAGKCHAGWASSVHAPRGSCRRCVRRKRLTRSRMNLQVCLLHPVFWAALCSRWDAMCSHGLKMG